MDWNVAKAKERLSELIRQAQAEPQMVYRRHELVAVVVDAASFERLRTREEEPRPRSLAEAAAEARAVLAGESFELEIPERIDRDPSFEEVA